MRQYSTEKINHYIPLIEKELASIKGDSPAERHSRRNLQEELRDLRAELDRRANPIDPWGGRR